MVFLDGGSADSQRARPRVVQARQCRLVDGSFDALRPRRQAGPHSRLLRHRDGRSCAGACGRCAASVLGTIEMTAHDLPAVNAFLNATAACLLIWGYTLIRRQKMETHRRVMLTAFGTSVLFL